MSRKTCGHCTKPITEGHVVVHSADPTGAPGIYCSSECWRKGWLEKNPQAHLILEPTPNRFAQGQRTADSMLRGQ